MQKSLKKIVYACAGALALFFIALYLIFIAPPVNFPKNSILVIPPGTTVEEAGNLLKEKHILNSTLGFSVFMRIVHPQGIVANHYSFKKPELLTTVALRLAYGKTDLTPVRVTIPEGASVREIADILKNNFGDFDSAAFAALATPQEGYLFPDTYFFLPDAAPQTVIMRMRANFDEKIKTLQPAITSFGRPQSDVIIMASILEREVRQMDTRRTVAGILWKRLQLKMPLQVDAVFGYILGKSGYTPTLDDLRIDSPYNTYLNRGFPPGPIGNPGLESIEAAITPLKTAYLYYLTDKEGNIYYAKTFEEHLKNKEKIN
jgi:UPF0755 protein